MPLACQLRLPMHTGMLQRSFPTPPQQRLTADQRSRNLRHAFTLAGQVQGARVLLVDDIMTTGETVHECCWVLAQGGAEEIQAAVVGRAWRVKSCLTPAISVTMRPGLIKRTMASDGN